MLFPLSCRRCHGGRCVVMRERYREIRAWSKLVQRSRVLRYSICPPVRSYGTGSSRRPSPCRRQPEWAGCSVVRRHLLGFMARDRSGTSVSCSLPCTAETWVLHGCPVESGRPAPQANPATPPAGRPQSLEDGVRARWGRTRNRAANGRRRRQPRERVRAQFPRGRPRLWW